MEGVEKLVFGLDIGTRSVVGTVGYRKGERFCVIGQRLKEHESRAMLDGQIHDIAKVGETIRQVKHQLEADIGRKLTEVCIAAAGRVLRTVTVYVEQDYGENRVITSEDIYSLATMGVEKAHDEFSRSNDTSMKFYCVGYTAIRYYMNGYPISNLEGHRAHSVSMDLIATFLPDDVVDGLYKAVEIAELQVVNLTLEPIAAMQVAIPERFRMLNLALVDVGAGTSDISITRDGAVTAYGMIPIAGDSLTDVIVPHCLVDFDMAEQIKKQVGVQNAINYTDIMGLPQTIESNEIIDILEEPISRMTKMVADCIRELNGDKSVSAVFVVGGGGLFPGYTQSLAEELGIVKERVAIRGEEVLQMIKFDVEDAHKDSLMITPIGICLCYYDQSNNFIFITFNGERLKLYDNGNLMLADAAIQSKFPNEALFPKRGEALLYTVNGKSRMLRGKQGEAAVITINGEEADIYAKINNGDQIRVVPSTIGEKAEMILGRLPEMEEGLSVKVNDNRITLPKSATVGGKVQGIFYKIQNGDDIVVHNCYTVAQVAELMEVSLNEEDPILVNGVPAKTDTKVYENFSVSWEVGTKESHSRVPFITKSSDTDEISDDSLNAPMNIAGLYEDGQLGDNHYADAKYEESQYIGSRYEDAEHEEYQDTESRYEDGKHEESQYTDNQYKDAKQKENQQIDTPYGSTKQEEPQNEEAKSKSKKVKEGGKQKYSSSKGKASSKDQSKNSITVNVNNSPVTLTCKKSYVFVDIFEFYNFDLSSANGRIIVTELNGRPAEYMEELKDGDVIDIFWR